MKPAPPCSVSLGQESPLRPAHAHCRRSLPELLSWLSDRVPRYPLTAPVSRSPLLHFMMASKGKSSDVGDSDTPGEAVNCFLHVKAHAYVGKITVCMGFGALQSQAPTRVSLSPADKGGLLYNKSSRNPVAYKNKHHFFVCGSGVGWGGCSELGAAWPWPQLWAGSGLPCACPVILGTASTWEMLSRQWQKCRMGERHQRCLSVGWRMVHGHHISVTKYAT